ncbi:hypothetical protein F5Y03DRAFT_400463 [Xylaria venustula]|nr:hypothetical protein F5Y03DRAFT_400463 [Xylaria venustula]
MLPDNDHKVALAAVWWSFFSTGTVVFILRLWARRLNQAILITYIAENGGTLHLLYLGGLPQIERTIMLYTISLGVGIFVTGVSKIAIGITILRVIGNTLLWLAFSTVNA